jgi:hypothetical protein
MFMSFNSNTTGVTYGAGTANPSGVPEFSVYIIVCPFSVGHSIVCPSNYGF